MGGKVGKQLERSGAAGKIGRQSGRMVGTWEGGRLGNSYTGYEATENAGRQLAKFRRHTYKNVPKQLVRLVRCWAGSSLEGQDPVLQMKGSGEGWETVERVERH